PYDRGPLPARHARARHPVPLERPLWLPCEEQELARRAPGLREERPLGAQLLEALDDEADRCDGRHDLANPVPARDEVVLAPVQHVVEAVEDRVRVVDEQLAAA